jgi:lipoprotein-releasing system ATP-binding protein
MNGDIAALRLTGVTRVFPQIGQDLEVLRGADCAVSAGELVALVGPSGAGKSTLLQIAGLLERPTSGRVEIAGTDASGLDDGGRTTLRREAIGFVYQFHRLLPEFNALENVVVPQMIAGVPRKAAAERARALLGRVGLAERASHRPGKLSGGEQQRVAIARALANAPALLLADEPTGNLDPKTAEGVFAVLRELIAETKLGGLIATHNLDLARRMDRVIELKDGILIQGKM